MSKNSEKLLSLSVHPHLFICHYLPLFIPHLLHLYFFSPCMHPHLFVPSLHLPPATLHLFITPLYSLLSLYPFIFISIFPSPLSSLTSHCPLYFLLWSHVVPSLLYCSYIQQLQLTAHNAGLPSPKITAKAVSNVSLSCVFISMTLYLFHFRGLWG